MSSQTRQLRSKTYWQMLTLYVDYLTAGFSASVAVAQQTEVRVALVAYEDFNEEVNRFERMFAELSHVDRRFKFLIAVGSYQEVQNWMDRQLVDVAVLTPGVFAATLNLRSETSPSDFKYLTSVQIPSNPKLTEFRGTYQAICVVPETSSIISFDELREAALESRVEWIFVNPLSLSGCLAPLAALQRESIATNVADFVFSYSHSQSIRKLQQFSRSVEQLERTPVAFLWDGASDADESLRIGIRKIVIPELATMQLPHDVVVARQGFEPAADLLGSLRAYDGPNFRFQPIADWPFQYGEVAGWLEAAKTEYPGLNRDAVTLEGLCEILLQYSRSQPLPPRLALVLSGGGAKCSYQVGAVSALEQSFSELRDAYPEYPIDIQLVVGTSGGAINAVPIAMGVSTTATGRKAFASTWLSLDQRQIVSPSWLVRANMGIWFALLQILLVCFTVGFFTQRLRTIALVLISLAIVELLLNQTSIPWHWLGDNHLIHHLWLWLGLGANLSAVCLLFLAGWLLAKGKSKTLERSCFNRRTYYFLAAGILGLPLIQMAVMLLHEETLSQGSGMEHTLAEKLPGLLREFTSQSASSIFEIDERSPTSRLQSASRAVIEGGLLHRDLVITGSCLEQTSHDLPSDLYFFCAASPDSPTPQFGNRGVALDQNPDILLDVVLGSGSIYPVFPARTIADVPHLGESIKLIDGGYSHNSPIEAAVLWGATHIIMIEATPRSALQRGSLLLNTTSAFRHLHQQAQLLDAKVRDKVNVFSLTPQPPHICVLDFADNLIAASIERGERDVLESNRALGRFRRELGEPRFRTILSRDSSTE